MFPRRLDIWTTDHNRVLGHLVYAGQVALVDGDRVVVVPVSPRGAEALQDMISATWPTIGPTALADLSLLTGRPEGPSSYKPPLAH
jgi:hypothetical protein